MATKYLLVETPTEGYATLKDVAEQYGLNRATVSTFVSANSDNLRVERTNDKRAAPFYVDPVEFWKAFTIHRERVALVRAEQGKRLAEMARQRSAARVVSAEAYIAQ